jgi:hypothetical protein
MKHCTKCKQDKELTEFGKRKTKSGIDKFHSWCKECQRLYSRKFYQDNPDKVKLGVAKWNKTNSVRVSLKKKQWKITHIEQHKAYESEWLRLNPKYKIEWNNAHPNYYNNYTKERQKIDINFKLCCALRSRLNSAINNNQKGGSAVDDLGCSVNKLKIYLQLKFHRSPRGQHEYMTWNNWTIDGWHIDHIKPLSSFDLKDPEQVKKACHYTNLQPLWAKDNLKKSDNYDID